MFFKLFDKKIYTYHNIFLIFIQSQYIIYKYKYTAY